MNTLNFLINFIIFVRFRPTRGFYPMNPKLNRVNSGSGKITQPNPTQPTPYNSGWVGRGWMYTHSNHSPQ